MIKNLNKEKSCRQFVNCNTTKEKTDKIRDKEMSVSQQTLDKIRAQLREAKDIGGNVPQDLYSHLTEVFNRILMHNSDEAFDKFEEISALVKQTDLKFKDPKMDTDVNAENGELAISARDAWIQRSKNLLNEVRSQFLSILPPKFSKHFKLFPLFKYGFNFAAFLRIL